MCSGNTSTRVTYTPELKRALGAIPYQQFLPPAQYTTGYRNKMVIHFENHFFLTHWENGKFVEASDLLYDRFHDK